MVQGGIVPTTTFTPAAAPFGLGTPTYVASMGTPVLSLYTQYFTPSWLALPGTSGNYMNLGATHPAHFDTRTSNLFMEAWVYSLAANGSVNQQIVAVTDNSSTTDWNMFIGTDNVVHFGYWAPSYTQVVSGAFSFTTWNHVALSWNPVTRAMYVFLNGVVSGPTTASTTGVYSAARELHIGSETTGSVFNGYIQDVRIVQGGAVPSTSFTPGSAPFGLVSPSYAPGGSVVLSLATQYMQKMTTVDSVVTDVTRIAGAPGNYGATNGPGATASFAFPYGVVYDSAGNIYVTDSDSHTVRKIIASTSVVSTLAGTAFSGGSTDGTGTNAKFNNPRGITFDTNGNIYVADSGNHIIRKIIASTGVVTTLAGTAGSPGSTDATGASARFNGPWGIACDSAGNVYVADTDNSTIRKIIASTGQVTTLAGTVGLTGPTDGTGSVARFNNPHGIVCDPTGAYIYVVDWLNFTIRRIVAASGVVTTLAGTALAEGSTNGVGPVARFSYPNGITCDLIGNIYVADNGNNLIRKIVASTAAVTNFAGVDGSPGSINGSGSLAKFNNPVGVASDLARTLYVADANNSSIRKIVSPPFTSGYGQPLFSQLSTAAASSSVGAYSLRALNATTAKVAKVNAKYPTGTFSTYTTVYGIVSASSEYPPGGDNPFAWKAFDGLTASPNYWASGANYTQGVARTTGTVTVAGGTNYYGDWLQIQLPVSFVPTGYALTLQQGRINAPGTWYVFGSTDGSTWTLLDTRSGIAYTSFTDQQASTFQITGATTTYNYYRIVCNIVSFNTSFALAEFVVLRSSDFWADRLGNLLTVPVTGQRIQDWLGGATGYVSTWYDQSGAGNHATQTVTGNQPTFNGTTINFTTAANQYMNTPSAAFPDLKSFTVTCRHTTVGNSGDQGIWGIGGTLSSIYSNNLIRPGGGGGYRSYFLGADFNAGSYAVGNIVTLKYDQTTGSGVSPSNGTRTLYVNSSSAGTNATTGWLGNGTGLGFIGHGSFAGAMDGGLYYICMFSTALSDSDRLIVESI